MYTLATNKAQLVPEKLCRFTLSLDRSCSESGCNYRESSLLYSHYQGVKTPQLREEQLVASAEVQPRAAQMTHIPPAFWRPSPSH